ncbi:MAG: hypothetical protein L0Z62_47760 [Gemmataceae bacterium]|nr:hypothetical protein [Gemmataceae bacterium]
MTEAEWLACTDPERMLESLRGRASERKLRLFACSCCRLSWRLLIDERSRAAVEVAERLADGLATDEEVRTAVQGISAASLAVRRSPDDSPETLLQLRRRQDPTSLYRAAFLAGFAVSKGAGNLDAHLRARGANPVDDRTQAQLLRCLFNPFRPGVIEVTSSPEAPIALARALYEDRIFEWLPILGDALEEAGCSDEAILAHCRGPGPHVRGCWVVDLILGKR